MHMMYEIQKSLCTSAAPNGSSPSLGHHSESFQQFKLINSKFIQTLTPNTCVLKHLYLHTRIPISVRFSSDVYHKNLYQFLDAS